MNDFLLQNASINILELPKEIKFNILMRLIPKDIINYIKVCKSAHLIIKDDFFWKMKAYRDYKLCFDFFNYDTLSPFNRYKFLFYKYKNNAFIYFACLREENIYFLIRKAIKINDLSLINFFLKKYISELFDQDKIYLLIASMQRSKIEVVKFLFEYFSLDQDGYDDLFGSLLYYHRCEELTNNRDIYKIMEFLLDNIHFNDKNYNLILQIMLKIPFSIDIFLKLLKVGELEINNVVKHIIDEMKSCFNWDKYYNYMYRYNHETNYGIYFINYIVDNYNLNVDSVRSISTTLIQCQRNNKKIKTLVLEGKLNNFTLAIECIRYNDKDLLDWLIKNIEYEDHHYSTIDHLKKRIKRREISHRNIRYY